VSDYLDDDMDNSRLPIAENTSLLQTLPNLRLNLGYVVLSSCGFDCRYSSLTETNITEHGSEQGTAVSNNLDPDFATVSHIINYRVSNLGEHNEQAVVVLPLENNKLIPEGATYRLFTPLVLWFISSRGYGG
jgi:hypothetical protein